MDLYYNKRSTRTDTDVHSRGSVQYVDETIVRAYGLLRPSGRTIVRTYGF